MATLTVGPGMQYATIADAVVVSHDGDIVDVSAGTYYNDWLQINTSITLQAVGGPVIMQATVEPPNEKGIVIVGDADHAPNVAINGITLTGAAISADEGNNGAGIRYQNGNLTLNNDIISNNQDGLLATPYNPNTGTIIINRSFFADNGAGDAQSHNIYVNQIAQFTFEDSVSVGAIVGHDIKSRAYNTSILNSVIGDGNSGTASYDIDLPNGGNAIIQGNVIEKGPNAENPVIVSFGEEGGILPNSALTVSDNTVINDLTAHIPTFVRNSTGAVATINDNQYYGLTPTQLASGPASLSNNISLAVEPPFNPTIPDAACYVAGTRITTPTGPIAIENLRAGDTILVLRDAQWIPQPIKWIGHRKIDLGKHPRPESVCPVRIRRDAFADQVPQRDLLISPEHCVFVDGALVPARLLINNLTIFMDRDHKSVQYYHLEIDDHCVLLAEGLPAESYLDTGNRGAFANAPIATQLAPEFGSTMGDPVWRDKLCAPLYLAPEDTAPTWRRLTDRARILGQQLPDIVMTEDADLRLIVGERTYRSLGKSGQHATFVLPAGASEGRIVSRCCVAVDVTPGLGDLRCLGVAIGGIVVRDGTGDRVVIPVDDPALSCGWHAVERVDGRLWRWTNGDGAFRLPRLRGTLVVELTLVGRSTYPLQRSSSSVLAA